MTKNTNDTLGMLLRKVYHDGGYDFRDYKDGTVRRRLERRLQAIGIKTSLDYIPFLDAHPEEYERLAHTLTIAVSGFFRSHYTFKQLERLVLPELLSRKISKGSDRLRFWSTACARGEEPYSLAITLANFLGNRLRDFDVQIYASDINRQLLKEARAGIYSPREVASLPPKILENYFTPHAKGYMTSTRIGDMVHFSSFDLTRAAKPPARELDCILCCNVLIYLQKKLQARLLGRLYEALANSGYLVLGEVETPTDNLLGKLKCLDGKAKIYQKNGGADA